MKYEHSTYYSNSSGPPKFSSFLIIDVLTYYIASKFTKKELGKMGQSPKKYLSLFREGDLNQTEINIYVSRAAQCEPVFICQQWLNLKL